MDRQKRSDWKYRASAVLFTLLIAGSAIGCSSDKLAESTKTSDTQAAAQSPKRTSEEEERIRSEALAKIAEGNGQNETEPTAQADPDQVVEADAAGSEPVQENGLFYKDGILIVNKKYSVPADYAPGVDPTAQAQVTQLLQDMASQGMNVSYDTSNFRSYDTQSGLYFGYVGAYGQAEADTFSARPGYSEHQTGLAFDLKDSAGNLITSPTEAQWLLDNSWKYGFIVRYQEGKEAITGYQAEPWHLRYIGDRAQEIAQSGLTLEEFLGVEGGDYVD
ncbi:M15 family metallopeptidase [Allobaculum mucilyticum]|uniref:M15 family metallopeptidase n=1 Tax=Allobaculum mucilyticum TaxID=2834459 RepID=UPI001E315AF5|nr:M15 family metallopeptidase [Allobaculum mucilyticum]UNT97216.1 M15 family metallopeptidase [Allobaculum mucilyticum]